MVSPGWNAGMSVRCDLASSFSIIRFDIVVYPSCVSNPCNSSLVTVALDARQNLCVFLAELHALQQVRAVAQRFFQSPLPAPAADLLVITVQQNPGYRHPAKIGGARVVRVVEQSAGSTGRICCTRLGSLLRGK